MSSMKIDIEKFDGNINFGLWQVRMLAVLTQNNLKKALFGKQKKPETMSDEDWDEMDEKALTAIQLNLTNDVLQEVLLEKTAAGLWLKLEELYLTKSVANRLALKQRLYSLRMAEGTSIKVHINEFISIINDLKNIDVKVDEEDQAMVLLCSLPSSYKHFRETIIYGREELRFDDVKSSLLSKEKLDNELSSSRFDVPASSLTVRGRSVEKRSDNNYKQRGRSQSSSKEMKCHHCGVPGHIKKYCWKLKKERKRGKSKARDNEKKNEDKGEQSSAFVEDFFVLTDEEVLSYTYHESSWVIDSGATTHCTSRKDFFLSYTPGDFGILRMGNNGVSKIIGKGDVCLMTPNGSQLILKGVSYAPDIRLNLISVSKLDDDGFCSTFVNGQWKLTKGSIVVARGKKDTALYLMQAKLSQDSANALEEEKSTELWHDRLGHMSSKGLDCLARKELLSGAKGMLLRPCVHCLAGKQKRASFKSSPSHRASNILDLVHSDVCGPLRTRSLGGSEYFVTFIDDHSRKIWVYTLRTKDQVLDVFKQFHAHVERQTGRKLKCIRTDNGGEYRGPLDDYCKSHGIRHQFTPKKTPQLNGLAERMNRTLLERVRCLLSRAKLPKTFWSEALNTAVYLLNLSPCIPLQLDVPERVWSGKDVSYAHLKVFGCKAFVHIPGDERSKLDAKTKQCIFLGYGLDEFGYKLYDPVERKIIRSRDVVFFEDQTIEDIERRPEKPKSQSSDSTSLDISPPVLRSRVNDDLQRDVADTGDAQIPSDGEENVEPDGQSEAESQVEGEALLRRSSRQRQPSLRYSSSEFVLLSDGGEPESFQEATSDEHSDKWFSAMQEEMKSLLENDTYELVELPKGKRTLKNKWLYKLKSDEQAKCFRHKARLVVKGFSQKKGVDFEEIFSPVVKMSSIRVVLGLAASQDLEIEQMDVKTAFLHGDLEEELYMEQPEGFQVKGKENLVCRLKKSIYGLKQAPRQWYKKFESFMGEHDFQRTTSDHCVFVKNFSGSDFLILLLYVDDMLIVGRDMCKIDRLKSEMSQYFAMKDLGPAKLILGMRITRDRKTGKLWLSQEKYIEKVLDRFNMSKAKATSTPLGSFSKLSSEQCPSTEREKEEMIKIPYASAVGSLMYAMICTRPDIAYAVGVVSRFLSNPGKEHWNAVKWILRYLRGTSNSSLCFGSEKPFLIGYTDADMAGDIDSRKSTSGYMINFAGGAVSWQSKLQKCVALSTTEAEFIAATEACKELLWMKTFLSELGFKQERYVLLCDSQSAIHLGKNPSFHYKSKHIDVRYHWIRDVLDSKLLELEKIHTEKNAADMMTKVVPREKHNLCAGTAGINLQ